jgi:membrane carboxypeptidase/penicillin-binding protein
VREAFEMSLNVPAVRVAQNVGVTRVQDVWHRAGFSEDLSNTPAIALGVDDVSMREVISAYSMFANLGSRSEPYLIERVTKGNDKEIYHFDPELSDGIDPAVAYIIHSLMRGVVLHGTAARLNAMGLGDLAGKTGTTSNYRDAWFVGYAPDLLTAVWVGFDDGTPLRMSSGEAAVPIWGAYMQRAPHAHGEMQPPSGVTFAEIEAMTGRLWQPGCGPSVTEVFLTGTEPREQCGGPFEGTFAMGEFIEPPMITDEQMQEMTQGMDMRPPEVIHDPDSAEMTSSDEDSSGMESSAESVRVRPPIDTTRRRPARIITPPPAPPNPVVIRPPPPVILPPPPPPPPPPA